MSHKTFIVAGDIFDLCLEIKKGQGSFDALELRKLNVLTDEAYDFTSALRYDYHTFPNGSIFSLKYNKGNIPALQF